MNFRREKKLIGMMCACTLFAAAGHQVSLAAGPSGELEEEIVAQVEASDVSIYSEENEESTVVAMAQKGSSYEVVAKGDDNWVKVAAGEVEGYLKVQGEVVLAKAENLAEGVSQIAQEAQAAAEEQALRQQVVDYALQFVGGRYRYGGNDPRTGVDCSGFTRFVMQNAAGISLNRSSGSQASQGRSISAEEMQPGDLIFYGKGKGINHVAIYIGNGQIVHASTEKTGIKTSVWNYRNPVKIVSVLG